MLVRLSLLNPPVVLLKVFMLGSTTWLVVVNMVGLLAIMALILTVLREYPSENRPFMLQLITVITL